MQTDGRPMTAANGPPERATLYAYGPFGAMAAPAMSLAPGTNLVPHEYELRAAVEKRERALRAALQHMSDEGLLDCIDGDTPPEERCGQCSCCVASAALAAAGGKL